VSRSRRLLTWIVLLVLMAAFGAGVNRYLASGGTTAFAPDKQPTQTDVKLALPGTVYFADDGGLFALAGTQITQLQKEGQGWTQPVLIPGGVGLLAVKVTANYYSDLYELNLSGRVEDQLSHDSGKVTATALGADDWLYYPAVGPGNTLYFSYDWPKGGVSDPGNGLQVDFSIWETTLGTKISRTNVENVDGITQQSWAYYYTGGDVSPVPLVGGGLLYVDFEQAYGQGIEVSQIRLDPKPLYNVAGSDGTALTLPQDDCAQPALNPDETEIAMICTPVVNGAPSSTESDLVVASFDAATGTLGPLHRIVTGTMAASPTWSPDGTDLIYLAPEAGDGYFELWYVKDAATSRVVQPKQVTSDLDLDGSAAVWTP
jgi:Tol biopolymer transport system component